MKKNISKFFDPPESLEEVVVPDFIFKTNKKKRTVKLMRRAHTPSTHLLNLQKGLEPSRKEPMAEVSSPHQTRPWIINLDVEKAHRLFRKFFARWKSAIALLVIGLVFILSLSVVNGILRVKRADYQVLARSRQGLTLLNDGLSLLFANPEKAGSKFQSSLNNFLLAKDDVLKLNSYHLRLLGGKKIDAALLTARALSHISKAVTALNNFDVDVLGGITQAEAAFVEARTNAMLAQRLEPSRAEIKELQTLIEEQIILLEDIAWLLGRDSWKRYLVLFQNNTEIRATGGFIGSFAILDVDRGKLKQLDVPKGGSYDLQGQLKVVIAPPKPLQLIKARWEFQDANWFPDFPTSAAKVAWFYNKAEERTVDGVIALNTNLLIDLLKITGPIEMSKYRRVINADNFLLETQKIVELEYDKKENKPKEFIGDLAVVILEKMKNLPRDQYRPLLQALLLNLEKKNIMLYAADEKIENHINQFGWGGQLEKLQEKEDYLGIVHTNIAGQKTDQVIKETITYEPSIMNDGRVAVTLTMERTHEGKKGELFRGVRNVDFVRVYVPEGATFISAEGFEQPPAYLFKDPVASLEQDKNVVEEENAFAVDLASEMMIYNQFGKTVFANWLQVDPGRTIQAKIKYQLPFKVTDQYQLFLQKQSGVRPAAFNLKFSYPGHKVTEASDREGGDQVVEDSQFIFERDKQINIKLQYNK